VFIQPSCVLGTRVKKKINRCCSDTTTTSTKTTAATQKSLRDKKERKKTNINFWDPFKLDENLPFQFRATTPTP
jgi:hypothetical protein